MKRLQLLLWIKSQLKKHVIEIDYELDKAKAKWNYDFEIMKIISRETWKSRGYKSQTQQQEIDYLRAHV